MIPYLVTLKAIKVNNWIIKASVFDEQILILFFNTATMYSIVRVFINEDEAHDFLERVIKNDPGIKDYYGGRSSS